MAILLTGCGNRFQTITSGERRLSQRLQEKLDDDALIWFNAPIGRRRLHPDFIVLHPSRGLLVLEVKDWQLDTIEQITPSTVTLLTPDGHKEVDNPLEQARGYVLAIKELFPTKNVKPSLLTSIQSTRLHLQPRQSKLLVTLPSVGISNTLPSANPRLTTGTGSFPSLLFPLTFVKPSTPLMPLNR